MSSEASLGASPQSVIAERSAARSFTLPATLGRIGTHLAANRLSVCLSGVICGVAVALFGHTIAGLFHDWWTLPDFSHGLVAFPFAFYLAYLQRHRLTAAPRSLDRLGVPIVAFGCVLFLAGRIGAEDFIERTGFLLCVFGMLWTCLGATRVRLLWFPFILVFACIPPPELLYKQFAAPLQLLGSRVATSVVQQLGIVAYQDGNVIQLPSMALGVEEACSGLRSLSALLVLSLLVGVMQCKRPLSRVVLVATAIPIAIGMNLIRIAGTAFLADQHPAAALGFYHSFSGWLVFVIGMSAVWVAAGLLRRILEPANV